PPFARCTTNGSMRSEQYASIALIASSNSRSRSSEANRTCNAHPSSESTRSALNPREANASVRSLPMPRRGTSISIVSATAGFSSLETRVLCMPPQETGDERLPRSRLAELLGAHLEQAHELCGLHERIAERRVAVQRQGRDEL